MAVSVGALDVTLGLDLSEFNKSVSGLEKNFKKVGKNITNIGKSFTTRVSAPIAAFGALSIKTFADFDDGMRRVQALSNATGDEFIKLTDTAKELGRTTRFTAREAARGMEFLALAGFETNEIIGTMPALLDLAAASGEDLGLVSDIVSDSMTAFGLSVSEVDGFVDQLAKTSSATNTNVAMLGEAFKFVAPVAKQFGMTTAETNAILGIMANNGIKASMAGTSLRMSLLRLTDPPKEAADTLSRLGIEISNADGSMRNIRDIITDLSVSFAGLTQQQKLTAASQIFGARAVSGMLSVIEGGPESLNKLTDAINGSGGAAQKMANTMESGAGGGMRRFLSALESLRIEVGEKLAPMFSKLLEDVTIVIRRFSELSPEVQGNVVQFTALAAVVGPMLIVLGSVITALGKIAGLVKIVGGVVAGLGAGFGSAAAVIGVAFVVMKGEAQSWSDYISQTFSELIIPVTDWVSQTKITISQLKSDFANLANNIKNIFRGVKDFLNSMFYDLQGVVGDIAQGIENKFLNIKRAITDAFREVKKFTSFSGEGSVGNFVSGMIPQFATGGIVSSPTVGMVGEGREPEAILPLSKLDNLLRTGSVSGGASQSGSVSIHIENMSVRSDSDIEAISREISARIRMETRRS